MCGVYEERSDGGAGKTGALKPGVCGSPVGWLGAHTACGAVRESGVTFPGGFPYDCDRAARQGTYKQVQANGFQGNAILNLRFSIHAVWTPVMKTVRCPVRCAVRWRQGLDLIVHRAGAAGHL